jgi:predicted O-linked N-acetylglucosamine transferase (SPINDLY family)/4-hydroxybenzoate polyprenyltransferase
VRWSEWYDTKIPLFLVCIYYAALSGPALDFHRIGAMAAVLATLCIYASFGHILNDFSDRAADRRAGKQNLLATLSAPGALAVVLLAAAAGVASAVFYWPRPGAVALLALCYAVATLYSAPPVRLKERGALGVMAAALAQRTAPAAFIFEAMRSWDWTAAALCILSTVIGLRYILIHQLRDSRADAQSGVSTFGTVYGAAFLTRLLRQVLLPLELACLGATIILMGYSIPAIWALGGVYLLRLGLRQPGAVWRGLSPLTYGQFGDLYCVYWPLTLATVLAVRNLAFLTILAFSIVWLLPNLAVLTGNALEGFGRLWRGMTVRRSPADGTVLADDAFANAVSLHNAGRLAEAEALYQAVLASQPRHFEAVCRLGIVRLQQQEFGEAAALLSRALSLNRKSADAHHAFACALTGLGQVEAAVPYYQKAIALRPDFAEAHNNIGHACQVLGHYDEAMGHYRRALALRPDYAEAFNNLGNTLHLAGQSEQAIACYEKAIAAKPDYAEAHWNLGNAQRALGRVADAVEWYRAAAARRPNYADAYNSLGSALHALGRDEDAIAAYRQALAIRADYTDAHINLGNALRSLGRLDQAIAKYREALAIRPQSVEALSNLGAAQSKLKAYDQAAESFEAALSIDRHSAEALSGYARTAAAACDWKRTERLSRELPALVAAGSAIIDPFTFLSYCGDPALQLACAKNFIGAQLQNRPAPLCSGPPSRNGKIRIAYVAAGFRRHPNAFLSVELFEIHDRARFEVIGISVGPDEASAMRSRIVRSFDSFHDVGDKGDREAAALISDMRIDIAVDRSGYTTNARPGIFASRPAPIQVNYLGYPGTLGADFYDYIIADPVVLPLAQREFFAEQIVHLPDCYQSNDSKRTIAASALTRQQAGLPPDGFVFCCFNNPVKITPAMFEVWMRLLDRVPASSLWLLAESAVTADNIRREAAARGIAPERVVFAPWLEQDQHLARHRLADLFLDTLPFNAHTTASDALWAGLPVLTCRGESFPGRVAASLLKAAGLPELETDNLADYEALALRLATEPQVLAAFRDRLQQNRPSCPLFDTARYCRHIEEAYIRMWETWQRGERPRSFAIAPQQAAVGARS